MSLRQNINKVHFDLTNRFEEVTIIEKSNLKLGLIEDCEHRSFHMQAINQNGARIRISPEIVF